jgi:glucosyltransferase
MKKVSMIIPCYNEEGNVELFYKEAVKAYKEQNYKLELVFIDDGSKDNTLKNLKELTKEQDCEIKVLSFSRNFGKESAIYAGLNNTTGDYTVIIDVDLQQPPELTIKMANILDENEYDCVCYYQEERIENKLLSKIKNTFYKTMNNMSEVELKQGASDFRMFNQKVKNSLIEIKEYYRFSKGIFSWIGFNTKYLPYIPKQRNSGTTKWSFIKLFKYGISGIISFSTLPLKLATYSGLILSLIAFIYLFVIIIQKLFFEISVPGYPTIVSCILLIGGFQLFCIGIIGEYLGKIYIETKKRPIYIIKEEVTNGKNKKSV